MLKELLKKPPDFSNVEDFKRKANEKELKINIYSSQVYKITVSVH